MTTANRQLWPHEVTPVRVGYVVLTDHGRRIVDGVIHRWERDAEAAAETFAAANGAKAVAIGRVDHYLTLVR